ncbi:hypothetical protein L9F63_026278, partial [Diploptera punctata]
LSFCVNDIYYNILIYSANYIANLISYKPFKKYLISWSPFGRGQILMISKFCNGFVFISSSNFNIRLSLI